MRVTAEVFLNPRLLGGEGDGTEDNLEVSNWVITPERTRGLKRPKMNTPVPPIQTRRQDLSALSATAILARL